VLIVLTGKTASGKDTIKVDLLKRYPSLKLIVTTTSRVPRDGEKDGVDYHFLTRDQFEKKIKSGDFVEYVEYGGNLYGTQKTQLEQVLNTDSIWRIDPSRAGEIRKFIERAFPSETGEKLIKKVVVIYISVADDVVLQRLKKRNLSDTEIEKRMEDDRKIWSQSKDKYDYIVENVAGKLEETVNKIIKIIEANQ